MCADEYADLWNDHVRKARKDHKCCACSEGIRKGEKYIVIKSLYDGSWDTIKQCIRCNTMMMGIADYTGEPVVATLDCGADPLYPGEVPDLDELAFVLPSEMQEKYG